MLGQVAEIARRHNLVVFSDEIYDKLILPDSNGEDTPHIAFAAVAPDVPCITFGGMSKNYLVPGWRIGWGIVSGDAAAIKPYTEGVHRLLRARLCANHPEQYAIKAALEGPQDHLIEVRRKLRSRRDLTQKWCESTPRVSCVAPRGAFYAFPRIDIPESDEVFVTEARHGCPRLWLRPEARNAALPHRVSAGGKDSDQRLCRNRRLHSRTLRKRLIHR